MCNSISLTLYMIVLTVYPWNMLAFNFIKLTFYHMITYKPFDGSWFWIFFLFKIWFNLFHYGDQKSTDIVQKCYASHIVEKKTPPHLQVLKEFSWKATSINLIEQFRTGESQLVKKWLFRLSFYLWLSNVRQ